MSVVTRPDGELVFVTGSSRSGKTTWVAHQLRAAPRLLVWDTKGEWWKYRCRVIASPAELRAHVATLPAPLARIAYVRPVAPAEFEFFCRLAWAWLRLARGALVVEELADVTHPGKAPVAWGEIIRKGLAYGPAIYAITQRPTESDSTAAGNASRLHCHRMQRARDCALMAAELRVLPEAVDQLKPFEWIERDAWGRVTHGAGLRSRAPVAQKPA